MRNFVSKVLVVSHCLLNKSVRWWQEGKPPERNLGLANEVAQYAIKHNIGLFQMPCPEFTFCGNPRPSRMKNEYEELPGFKEHCEKLAKETAKQIKTLITMGVGPKIQVIAIIGIKRSPSCAVSSAVAIRDGVLSQGEKGIFIELLEKELHSLSQDSPTFLEYDFDNPSELIESLERLIRSSPSSPST